MTLTSELHAQAERTHATITRVLQHVLETRAPLPPLSLIFQDTWAKAWAFPLTCAGITRKRLYDYVEWDIPRAVAAFPFGSMKALHVYPALKSGFLGARADTCKARCTSAPEAPHVSVLVQ